jgi:hypothetical protein
MKSLEKIRKEGADAEPSPDDPAYMRLLRRARWGPDRGRWAWLLSHFWAEKDPGPDHWEAAKDALEKEEHNPADDEARRKLGFALVGLWREIFPRLWADDDMGSPATKIVQKHGFKVVKQTSILADEIEARFGASGKETSRYMLAAAHERWAQAPLPLPNNEPQLERDRAAWALWTDHVEAGNPSPILVILARLLWVAKVKAELKAERERAKRDVAYTPQLTLLPVVEVASGKAEVKEGVVRDRRGQIIGDIAPVEGTTIEALARNLRAFQHVVGHKLFRAVVRRTHQNFVAEKADPRIVEFEGGRQGVIDALGLSKSHHSKVGEFLDAGQGFRRSTPKGYIGGLWTWWERRGTRKAPGLVRIVAGDPIAYEAITTCSPGLRSGRRARRLIPELRHDPPTSGARERDHGKVWNLSRLVVIELVDLWRDLVRYGAGRIPPERWEQLAESAGLPVASLQRVLDSWLEGGGEEAPQLLEKDGDLYRLASPHRAEMDFILDGAKKREEGRKGTKWRKKGKKKRRSK